MFEIKNFRYQERELEKIRDYRFGDNWPIVYIIEDGNEAYIGETATAYNRAKNHFKKPERAKLQNIYIIADDEYNKSATLDIESSLIKYMSGDGIYELQNGNDGIKDPNYYDRERYQAKFETIWEELQKINLVEKDLFEVENSDLFKYSPYKTLSNDQHFVVNQILSNIEKNVNQHMLVSGEPGTGKTIVATYLMKALASKIAFNKLEIGLVIPMTSLRSTLQKVFRKVKGLDSSMVIGPYDVVKKKYDLLIVDEAHRLQRRVNLTNYKQYDDNNKKLGLDKNGDQLDWIMMSSKFQVLFYDSNQSIKPSDVDRKKFLKKDFTEYKLSSQMRVKGGSSYIEYIRNIFHERQDEVLEFYEYDIKILDEINDLIEVINEKEEETGLSRLLAGYAWKWETKNSDEIKYDIEIAGVKLKWNSVNKDWVNSPDATKEVGCIHTIQGYDLNYAGVIIGPEIYYDKKSQSIEIDKDKYHDFNGKRSITDPRELDNYIKNIYITLMTRGIKGTYVYVVDEGLRGYLSNYI